MDRATQNAIKLMAAIITIAALALATHFAVRQAHHERAHHGAVMECLRTGDAHACAIAEQ